MRQSFEYLLWEGEAGTVVVEQVLEYFLGLEYLIIMYPSIRKDDFMTFLDKCVPYEEQVIFCKEFVPI